MDVSALGGVNVRLTPDRGLGVQSWKLCDSVLKALVVLGDAFVRRPVQLARLVPVGWCAGRSAGRISACGSWWWFYSLSICSTIFCSSSGVTFSCSAFSISGAPDCSSKFWAIFTITAPSCLSRAVSGMLIVQLPVSG